MRFLTIVTPLTLLVLEVTGAAVTLARGLTESDVVQALASNPNLLPESSRQVLAARLQEHDLSIAQLQEYGLSKRTPQKELPPIKDENLAAVMAAMLGSIGNSKKIPPRTNVSEIQELESLWPGAKKRKIRYGPFRIPPITEVSLESRLLLKKGTANSLSLGATRPCKGDCIITQIATSIEWDDGRTATAKEGAYLHHAVLLNIGPEDPVCGGPIEHLFEAGNERTDGIFGIPGGSIKSGYHVKADDVFMINTELMNMDDKEKWVWLAMTFDYLEGHDPAYKDGKVIWMSIGPARCGENVENPFGRSNMTITAKPTQQKFEEHSIPWKAKKNGFLLGSNSHIHDGGIQTEIFQNDKVICRSIPKYSASIMGGMGSMPGGHSKRSIDIPSGGERLEVRSRRIRRQEAKNSSLHIESLEGCIFAGNEIPFKKGDSLYLRVDYDFNKYPGMRNSNGELEEIMGLAGNLVAFDYP
ncbi:hypothetical protein EG328_005336 [Venturia inaequalis]|uniref:Uncharacterized protein n=1 Tax=Venturia inaequalis TaxID=5025 RepID=A0A8H3VFE4_VENIN|nr:hypothetical protein EG328_005336 [Venturia inaequalis]KAE9986058.1 hypothetical protein EG327_004469 [Venturia inaequalis]